MNHYLEALLIYPLVTTPVSPAAGAFYLKSTLQNKGFSCHIIDANTEELDWILGFPAFQLKKQTSALHNLQSITHSAILNRKLSKQ